MPGPNFGRGDLVLAASLAVLAFMLTYALDARPPGARQLSTGSAGPQAGSSQSAMSGSVAPLRSPALAASSPNLTLEPVILPAMGALDLQAVAMRDAPINGPGLLRDAVQKFVGRGLVRARRCLPADLHPTVARVHVRVRASGGQAEVLEMLDLTVQRGAPLPDGNAECLLQSLRQDLPQAVTGVSPNALPEFDGDTTVLAILKIDPACGL
jgi:hypothetical protein